MSAAGAIFPPDEEPQDEFVQMDDEGSGVDGMSLEPSEDGGLMVTIGAAQVGNPMAGGFYDNLAEILPDSALQRIASNLVERIEQDKSARKKGDEQYEEALRRTGMGKDAPGGADFEGASRVVHPMMTEAAIDYEARIMKELWPVGTAGPVRPNIVGDLTAEKDERAKRKVDFLNYQLTTIIKEARPTMERMLTQVPLGGAQYIRQWYDPRLKRARWSFVPFDKVWVPEGSASYYSATRRTYSETLDGVEFRQRVDAGVYRAADITRSSLSPEPTKAEEANRKIEGVEDPGMNLDAQHEIYETMAYLDISAEMAEVMDCECEGELYPYLISIDAGTRRVLAIYRDWEQDDPVREPIDHLFEFPFVPWRGAHAVGLAQIIGGLSGAATGALRALLDSAYIANTQGGLILKGSNTGAQTQRAQIGQFIQIDGGGLETPDIRNKVMPFASKEPSPTLFQLLGFLVEAGKGAVRTTLDDDVTDADTNVPVGTQLSRVENGLVVFSALHGRIHEAFNRLLMGLHRLNRLYLDDVVRLDAAGKEIIAYRADFEGPCDIQPVSNPTVYSDQQRMAQIQAVLQRSDMDRGQPQPMYDRRKVEERFLDLLRIPDADDLLAQVPEPTEINAVAENKILAMGNPAYVFDDQDHLAHLQAHLDFMGSPLLGGNPIIAPRYLKNALDHCAEHIVNFYVTLAEQTVRDAAGGIDPGQLVADDPKVKAAFDQLLAMASQKVTPEIAQTFSRAQPVLAQAMAALAKLQPPPPMDPAQAALIASQAETQRKAQADQTMGALKQAQLQLDQQAEQDKVATAHEANMTRMTQTGMETTTAKQIAGARIAGGGQGSFRNGSSLQG